MAAAVAGAEQDPLVITPLLRRPTFPWDELAAYVLTHLQEGIQAEGLVRRLPQFSRFLASAALTRGQMLNFAAIADDAGLPASIVREHYFLLEDTLVGFLLPAWTLAPRATSHRSQSAR